MSHIKRKDESEIIHQYSKDILAAMPNLVYVLDKNCTFVGANANFLHLVGMDKMEDLVGKTYKEMTERLPWSEERTQMFKRDDINALLSSETVNNPNEAPILRSKDDVVYFESTRVPIFDEGKNVIGLVVILSDVTAYKRMEEQLAKIKNQLQEDNVKSHTVPVMRHSKAEFSKKIPKILMVEDNSIAQKAAQALLMQLDCHVDVADSGEKAISLFKPGKYDLVFMDIGLEGTSGYVVSKQIRKMEDKTGYRVPIIALTGFEADIVKYDCVDYFMEGALTKPLTSEQAKQIIQHYIYEIDIPVRGLRSTKGIENNPQT
ncbi:response regulator [Legionella hackeliae]|uniref:Putative Sensory box sensor histidine kinase/response regulator n=1 Tax=Legionella hackeliae TaxID=449 RepID=A0A0A8UUT6_LEGHA|nr:response regulator [Legionella hackeliae]KTD13848.1 sensory box sensor histidine kinase/response regulator [Legionella hackeliae]CEK10549.1 Putative Sensory box sensor histidine kinase/response regulator [Legionella hackeliae]STX47288.1 sensory box sensor histidine kinase/response regulator [Legionella hackeliae]